MARRRFFQAGQKAAEFRDAVRQQPAQVVHAVGEITQSPEVVVIDETKPLIDVKEVQRRLGLRSIFAVYRLKDNNGLPFRRLGRAVMFHPDEVTLWTIRHRERDPKVAMRGLQLVASR
ncbi:MAG TPA: hypothetical protein VF491_17745 [Vicinamibacterales bacterium]